VRAGGMAQVVDYCLASARPKKKKKSECEREYHEGEMVKDHVSKFTIRMIVSRQRQTVCDLQA
jgi:hypothetical protein